MVVSSRVVGVEKNEDSHRLLVLVACSVSHDTDASVSTGGVAPVVVSLSLFWSLSSAFRFGFWVLSSSFSLSSGLVELVVDHGQNEYDDDDNGDGATAAMVSASLCSCSVSSFSFGGVGGNDGASDDADQDGDRVQELTPNQDDQEEEDTCTGLAST